MYPALVAGYTRLMTENEATQVATLERIRLIAFCEDIEREAHAYRVAVETEALAAKARRPQELASAIAKLPECEKFEGTGRRCSTCRVHANAHR
jgi:hypothetical protein